MAVKVGINGFGRIGRQVYKAIYENYEGVLDVEAINDLMPVDVNAHMLKYDSTYGRFPGEVEVKNDAIYVDGEELRSFAEKNPADLPWDELGVDVVLECTGIFRDRESASKHLDGGAKKVIISAPAKGIDATFVLGVNEGTYDPDNHHIISNASCTTNCLAPAMKALNDAFGVKRAFMSTIHAITNGQKILDTAYPKDLRRARTASANIIPTTTGAARAVGLVLPELDGKINGMAFRVPVVTGSVVDIVAELEEDVTVESLNTALKEMSEQDNWLGKVLDYSEEPLVSTDYIGHSASSTIDALSTDVMGNLVKVVTWYDNEWGYSVRLADLAAYVAERL